MRCLCLQHLPAGLQRKCNSNVHYFGCVLTERCGYDGANPALTMYEVMSGDTLSWKVPSPRQSSADPSPESHFAVDTSAVKILKVCFCTNNSLGKNFKLVKCDSSWQVRVRWSTWTTVPVPVGGGGSMTASACVS